MGRLLLRILRDLHLRRRCAMTGVKYVLIVLGGLMAANIALLLLLVAADRARAIVIYVRARRIIRRTDWQKRDTK